MAKILIAGLGKGIKKDGKYKETNYSIELGNNDSIIYENENFITSALEKHFEIDKTIYIGTVGSMWDNLYSYYCDKYKLVEDEEYTFELLEASSNAKQNSEFSEINIKKFNDIFKEKAKIILTKFGVNTNEIFENLSIDVEVEDISQDGRNITLFTNSSGDEFDINELSSGEKQLFLRTLAIKMLNPENSIILIDEPELSLHPKWQQRIVDVYRKIGKNNQIIIATHSPHILGSVKKENIMLLDKDSDGKIVVRTGDELYDSYGQPTERILEDIMGLKTTRNQEIFDKLEKIREMVNEDKYETDDFKKEYGDLKEILGTMDEDVMLIDMEIQIRRKGLKNVKNK